MNKADLRHLHILSVKTRNLGEKENETATAETLIIEYTT